MKIKNVLIGAGIGTAAGCVAAAIRVPVAFCPPLWPIGDAAVAAMTTHRLTDGDEALTVLAGGLGFVVGLVEMAVFPVTSAMILLQAPLYVPLGACVGGAIGSQQ